MKQEYLESFDLTMGDREKYETENRFVELLDSMWMDRFTYDDVKPMYDLYTPSEAQKSRLRDVLEFLTTKQRLIVEMLLEGHTQLDIAEKMGVDPSCISLSLYGSNAGHGGIIKKLKQLVNGRKCKYCGKEIDNDEPMQKVYCSGECKPRYEKGHCLCCGEKLTGKKTKFCNNNCNNKYRYRTIYSKRDR